MDIFSKYAGVVSLKEERLPLCFKTFFDKPGCKPNKIWVDKGIER